MVKSNLKKKKTSKNLLLGITASIAAYKACELVRIFRKAGYSVRCVMSKDAEQFVTSLTFETLSGKKTISHMFARPENLDPVHISLAEESDLVLIAPATADTISKIAAGICDDILTCTVCAVRNKPVIFAPAMNDGMYLNPIVQDKIAYLKEKGYHFIAPVEGRLASGKQGIGHLAPLEEIFKQTEKIFSGTK